jgi:transcriptional regulator with XRE-family HTH domain
MTAGKYLKEFYKKSGHGRKWHARRIGISFMTLKRIEEGRSVTEPTAYKVAEYSGIPIEKIPAKADMRGWHKKPEKDAERDEFSELRLWRQELLEMYGDRQPPLRLFIKRADRKVE